MVKTITIEIPDSKYKINDKIIYFSGPHKNEPLKCKVLDVVIEGEFYYDAQKDIAVVCDYSRHHITYARYLLKILEEKNAPDGSPWMKEGECLYPQISLVDKYSEKYE